MAKCFVLAAVVILVVLMVCHVDANKNKKKCKKGGNCSTGSDDKKYKFTHLTKEVKGKRQLIITYKKYSDGKLVKTKDKTFTLKSNSPSEMKKVIKNYKRKVKKGKRVKSKKQLHIRDITTSGGEYHLTFSKNNSTVKGKRKLTIVYSVYKNGTMVKDKTKTYTLKTQHKPEATKIFKKYKTKIEKLYKVNESVNHFTFALSDKLVTVFCSVYKNGKLIDRKAETHRIFNKTKSAKEIEKYKNSICKGLKPSSRYEKPQEFKYREIFPFTTDQGKITGESLKYTEKFAFKINGTTLIANFKLYNDNNKLMDEKTKEFPVESNDQGVMNKIIRRFTDDIHNSKEFNVKEKPEQKDGKSVKYQEYFYYRDDLEENVMSYRLYNHGKLVHTDSNHSRGEFDKTMNEYIESVHKEREAYEGWKNDVNRADFKTQGKDGIEEQGKVETMNQPLQFEDEFSFKTNQVLITAESNGYNETFTYFVKKNEIRVEFKLYNANGNLVTLDTKRFPLTDNNQAEIDLLVRGYIQSVRNGTGETLVENDDYDENEGDANIRYTETFSYFLSSSNMHIDYRLYKYLELVDSQSKWFPAERKNHKTLDEIFYKHMDTIHKEREKIYQENKEKEEDKNDKQEKNNDNNNNKKEKDKEDEDLEEYEEYDYDENEFEKIIGKKKEFEYKDDFSFTTTHGTIRLENVMYTEIYSYTTSTDNITATFKLYNSIGNMINSTTQIFSLVRNDQASIDRIIRQFTESIYGGVDDDEQSDDYSVGYQEKVFYVLTNWESHKRYQLYDKGKLIHSVKENSHLMSLSDQRTVDQNLNEYIEVLHTKREKGEGYYSTSRPQGNYTEKQDVGVGEDNTKNTNKQASFTKKFSYTTDQITIRGDFIRYNETFSYVVKNDEMRVTFKLYNFKRKLLMVKMKSFPLPDNNQAEIDKIMRSYIKNIHKGVGEKLVEDGEEYEGDPEIKYQEKFSFLPGSGTLYLQYELYNYEKLLEKKMKPHITTKSEVETVIEVLYDFIESNHKKREAKVMKARQKESKKHRHKFLYTTNQGMISGENLPYKEKFSFTASQGKLRATFELYNSGEILMDNRTQVFPIESNKPDSIDNLVRQFTNSIHNGKDYKSKKENKGKNKISEYQETFSYSLSEKNITLRYKLYNNGTLAYNNKKIHNIGNLLQRNIDKMVNKYVEYIHRKRASNKGWKKSSLLSTKKRPYSLQNHLFSTHKKQKSNKDKRPNHSKDAGNENVSPFPSNQIFITGENIIYNEKFFYVVKDGKMDTSFALFNSNGKLMKMETKTFPLTNNNQAEIDKIMRKYVELVHNGTDDEDEDDDIIIEAEEKVEVEHQEKFQYLLKEGVLIVDYDRIVNGSLVDFSIESFPVSRSNQKTFDEILFDYMADVRKRKENVLEEDDDEEEEEGNEQQTK